MLHGPTHVVAFANTKMGQIWGRPLRQLLGQPHFAALPDLAGQGFEDVFDGVFRTGEPRYFNELPVAINQDGHPYEGYFNIAYQPAYDGAGLITGILASALEVSGQVHSRQQVQNLNEELAAINEELRASNEEFLTNNVALMQAQQELHALTHDLEARVAARTHEAHAAQVAAEHQRRRLERFFQQAPAAICVLDGPELVYELVNPGYQQLFPGRELLGKPLLVALPELTGQPVWQTLQRVYQTGETHLELGIHIPVARTEGGPLEDFYFNYIQQARYDEHGQVDGVLVFTFEVTQQALAQQQVQNLNQELAAVNEELQATNEVLNGTNHQLTRVNVDLDTFIYAASHDLKAPITNIEGLLYTLRGELPAQSSAGEVPYILDLMQDSVERFTRTIEHLTDVSKLHKTFAEPAYPLLLAPVIEDVRLDLAPLLHATGGHLDVDVRAVPALTFSEKNLRSVVYN